MFHHQYQQTIRPAKPLRFAWLAAAWYLAGPALAQEPPAVPLGISADLDPAGPNRLEFPPATARFVRLSTTIP